ncbi:MAG: hypothetical protein QOH06_6157 [Acidobacteriota bacterium]|jgi:hypothetical protein|nr:hypothetical protein [Acidobacteriota bacterium]
MKKLLLVGGCFTVGVLLIDFLGIHVFHDGGLGFRIQYYSWWLTLLPVTAVFAWCLRRKELGPGFTSLFSFVCGAAWWALTSLALFYLHGVFGGTY